MVQQGEIKVIEQQEQHYQQQEQSSISSDSNELPIEQEEESLVDIINLKTIAEWSEEELNMIENINDNTVGIANFAVDLLKKRTN